MDYSAENQQQKADAAAQQQQQTTPPATTQTPTTPPADAATTTPADDDKIVLDDLFPPETPTTPAATTTPANPNTPAQAPAAPPDDAVKQQQELEARLAESEKKLNGTLINSVDALNQKIDRNNQLASFFQKDDNAPFRKYQDAIVKVATDSRFIGLPLDRAVALALGPQAMLKLGAQLASEANTRANGNRTGGNQNASRVVSSGTTPDYSKMSDAEFNARTQAIMRGERPN